MRPAISLLVHAKLPSVQALVLNLLRKVEPCVVCIHVSATADFSIQDCERLLAPCGDAVYINHRQRHLAWGRNIVDGHEENLSALLRLGIPGDSPVLFAASNDWYLSPVTTPWTPGLMRLQTRPAGPDCVCVWTRREAPRAVLHRWAEYVGMPPRLSQIEGSVYPLAWALTVLDAARGVLGNQLYEAPAEEYVWPTAAGDHNAGSPLVYSEVIRSEVAIAAAYRHLRPLLGSTTRNNLLELQRRVIYRRGRWKLTSSDLRAVYQTQTAPMPGLVVEGSDSWRAYSAGMVFGVKRIPLHPSAPLRRECLAFEATPSA